mmetsp:Transcript_9527/g.20602  ORF Transcript_9527/g.20602 Transcript_9527/m.20602 type:complete len:211 (-) Transcript_9527:502-1134(-)
MAHVPPKESSHRRSQGRHHPIPLPRIRQVQRHRTIQIGKRPLLLHGRGRRRAPPAPQKLRPRLGRVQVQKEVQDVHHRRHHRVSQRREILHPQQPQTIPRRGRQSPPGIHHHPPGGGVGQEHSAHRLPRGGVRRRRCQIRRGGHIAQWHRCRFRGGSHTGHTRVVGTVHHGEFDDDVQRAGISPRARGRHDVFGNDRPDEGTGAEGGHPR